MSLLLLACCLKILSSAMIASLVIVEIGNTPVMASARLSAALISASEGVSVGIVKYLCLKNTELQTRVLLVLLM